MKDKRAVKLIEGIKSEMSVLDLTLNERMLNTINAVAFIYCGANSPLHIGMTYCDAKPILQALIRDIEGY